MKMGVFVVVGLLLCLSNVFMTFAWFGHLKDLSMAPWYKAVLISWLLAFFEYLLQVPANRLGNSHGITLDQLKMMQEVITLSVFIPFAIFYMQRPLSWNFCWAGLCMCAAVYFVFRG